MNSGLLSRGLSSVYKYSDNGTYVHTRITYFVFYASVVSTFQYLLCDTLTSSATFHTPEVTKQSWKLRCPVPKSDVIRTYVYTQQPQRKKKPTISENVLGNPPPKKSYSFERATICNVVCESTSV